MNIIYFFISLSAAFIGAISGIGGGVIIKPSMDFIGSLSVSSISFLSGCTVLTMATVSLFRNVKSKNSISININETLFLAIGACIGGILGNNIFDFVKNLAENENFIGSIQSIILLLINISIVLYIKNKNKIATLKVKNNFFV